MADLKTTTSQWYNSNFGNCGVVGCWGTDAQGRKTLNGVPFEINKQQPIEKPNQYEVTCKDGTKDISNGVVIPCAGHGGVNSQAIKNAYEKTTKESIYYIALTTGVLVAGYLLWKKIK